jgi:chemotaxis protein CheD
MRRAKNVVEVFVQPGKFRVADAGYRIRTSLGPCAVVTLWHLPLRKGALAHFLFNERGAAPALELGGRTGDDALRLVLSQMMFAHIAPQECVARILVGGSALPRPVLASGFNARQVLAGAFDTVDDRHGEIARAQLRRFGIPIVAESTYGAGRREITFDVASGHAWMRQIKPSSMRAPLLKKSA